MKLLLSSLVREARWLQDGLTTSNLCPPLPQWEVQGPRLHRHRGWTQVPVEHRQDCGAHAAGTGDPTARSRPVAHSDALPVPFPRTWSPPRCRWCAWWSPTNSGTRRSRTSASGRRRTAWASRWARLPAAECRPIWGASLQEWKCRSSSLQESSGEPQTVAVVHQVSGRHRPHLEIEKMI